MGNEVWKMTWKMLKTQLVKTCQNQTSQMIPNTLFKPNSKHAQGPTNAPKNFHETIPTWKRIFLKVENTNHNNNNKIKKRKKQMFRIYQKENRSGKKKIRQVKKIVSNRFMPKLGWKPLSLKYYGRVNSYSFLCI